MLARENLSNILHGRIFGPKTLHTKSAQIVTIVTGDVSKTDDFSEKFKSAFGPLPHFQKNMLQFFSEEAVFKALFKGPKSHKFLD